MTILVYDPGNPGDWKESVLCCATAAPAAYARVDNVYTAAAVGALPNIDGVPCAVGSRVLLALSPANADNGILEVTSLGSAGTAWTMKRADDCNADANFTAGMMVPIEQGTVNGARVFKLSTTGAIVVNTTPVLFVNAGSLALCTSALDGTVNEFGATDGQILGSDGATAGGVWRNDLNVKPGVVTVTGRLLRGASPATVGEVALSDTDRVTCRTGAVDQAVISSSGTTVTVGGAPGAGTTRPATVQLTAATIAHTGQANVNGGGLWCDGTTGATPTSGAGTRMMWIPAKGAFRAGSVLGTQWDDANVGTPSVAFGRSCIASGSYSFACGDTVLANATASVALGNEVSATASSSMAVGSRSSAYLTGQLSVACGKFSAVGDAQRSSVSLWRSASENTPTELTLTGAAPAAGTRLLVPSGKSMKPHIHSIAKCIAGSDAGRSAYYYHEVAISNVGGTTALDGTNGSISRNAALAMVAGTNLPYSATGDDAGLLAMTLVPTADNTNDCLAMTFTGEASSTGTPNVWYVVSEVYMPEVAG